MPRRASAWMLSLAATLGLALPVALPARADVVPDQVDFAGAGQVLPPAVKAVLDLRGFAYEQRADYVLVTTSDPAGVLALLQPFVSSGVLRYAERNVSMRLAATPDDPLLGQEGFLVDLAAEQAWDRTNGASVTIGIVDSGVDFSHPDLVPNLASAGANLFARNGTSAADDDGHGTEVAGAAAARGANGLGLAGIAWGSRILPVKVTDAQGAGAATDIADGIRFAVANGAKVVNVSMAGDDRSAALDDAMAQARAAGVLLVVAAGNAGRDIDAQPAYPASSPLDNVIAVGATGPDHTLAPFSNRGPGSVDIAAPGVDVLTSCRLGPDTCSTIAGAGYSKVSGTSIATPLVAGMAALVIAVHPDWGPSQVRTALVSAAAACRPVAGTASGELCAPADLRGAAQQAPSGQAGGAGTTAGSVAAVPPIQVRRGVTTLRWRLTGDRRKIRHVRVRVDRRRARRLGARAMRLTVRGRPGVHRYVVTLVGARGKVLSRVTGRFRILP